MKITGAELQQFVDEGWPGDDWYWDHDVFEEIDPDASYETNDLGDLYWQGERYAVPSRGEGLNLNKLISRWRKERDHEFLSVLVPKDRKDEFLRALAEMGGKVSK